MIEIAFNWIWLFAIYWNWMTEWHHEANLSVLKSISLLVHSEENESEASDFSLSDCNPLWKNEFFFSKWAYDFIYRMKNLSHVSYISWIKYRTRDVLMIIGTLWVWGWSNVVCSGGEQRLYGLVLLQSLKSW